MKFKVKCYTYYVYNAIAYYFNDSLYFEKDMLK